MHTALRTILKASVLSTFLLLPACKFVDVVIGPPCDFCYSGGGGSDGGYDDGSSSDWGRDDDRTPNPPRYRQEPDPRRDERDARNREREREHRPPTHLEMATMTVMKKYSLREDSAEILAQHFLEMRAGNTHSLEELGITQNDIEAMARGQNPSASVLLKMAEVLRMDLGEVHNLIQLMKADLAKAGVI